MNSVERADGFQRRHPALGYPIGVIYKFVDDQGAYLAALITYYGFLSIFPLLLLLQSVLGFVIDGDDRLRQQILDSVLAQIPVLGPSL
ncbi:MAG: YihY/virulence factor BrkB family protein, partial [Dermacoccus nishinomiyaensis]